MQYVFCVFAHYDYSSDVGLYKDTDSMVFKSVFGVKMPFLNEFQFILVQHLRRFAVAVLSCGVRYGVQILVSLDTAGKKNCSQLPPSCDFTSVLAKMKSLVVREQPLYNT